jgi:hypothetical protein
LRWSRGARDKPSLAVGLAAHLALDQLNPVITHPLFYWITVRARYGFRARQPLLDAARYARGSAWMKQRPTEWF